MGNVSNLTEAFFHSSSILIKTECVFSFKSPSSCACMLIKCCCLYSSLELVPSIDVGCYYLADAGYKLEAGYLTPYRETRYHKDAFVGVDMKKLTHDKKFNRIHSELRNIIERRFGVLKER
jgi:hypothetical protein